MDNDQYLDDAAIELIDFHRYGFGVDEDCWVNGILIYNKMKTSQGVTHLIQHFSQ